jgi:flagellar motor protein MotB
MAEIMLLLIFCLLIALAAYLRIEKAKVDAAEARLGPEDISQIDRRLLETIKKNSALYEKLRELATAPSGKAVDDYWRDLVADQATAVQVRKLGLSPEQVRQKIAEANALDAKGVDAATALHDVDIVNSIRAVMPNDGSQLNPQRIKETIQKGLDAKTMAGHQWPPIISLSEANGHYFKTGSAELSPEFRQELTTKTPERIAELIQQYDVDVIEVVGHTDEQPIGSRPSNLDWSLIPVLKNGAAVGSLVPADNAGLGLARAVSVVSVLRQSKLLDGYKLIPLSGAQLVNTDETLALAGTPGDIRERRRIEIRIRKSSPNDSPASSSIPNVATTLEDIPLPRPKPIMVAKPKVHPAPQTPSNSSLSLTQP